MSRPDSPDDPKDGEEQEAASDPPPEGRPAGRSAGKLGESVRRRFARQSPTRPDPEGTGGA